MMKREPMGIGVRGLLFLLTLFLSATAAPGQSTAQKETESPPSIADARSSQTPPATPPSKSQKPKKKKRGNLVVAPIPVTSPAVGSGLVLVAAYVFKINEDDKLSPPSTVGIAAAFTNNGSRGIGLGGRLYFKENKYQTTFAAGTGRIIYDFFGIGRIPGKPAVSVALRQGGKAFFGEFLRNVGKDIFVGGRFQHRSLYVRPDEPQIARPPGGFEIPPLELQATTVAIGVAVQRDKRDSQFYPTKGSLFDAKGDFFDQAWGSKRQYQTYRVDYSGFHEMKPKQILAYQAVICSANQSVPFYDLCFYGFNNDLRGYTAGEFQNRRMFAGQAEYRVELPRRFGIVAFGGVGAVARRWNEFRSDQFLPAGGAGLRFTLDKKNHINYRIDWAVGRAGHTLTIGIGEAF